LVEKHSTKYRVPEDSLPPSLPSHLGEKIKARGNFRRKNLVV